MQDRGLSSNRKNKTFTNCPLSGLIFITNKCRPEDQQGVLLGVANSVLEKALYPGQSLVNQSIIAVLNVHFRGVELFASWRDGSFGSGSQVARQNNVSGSSTSLRYTRLKQLYLICIHENKYKGESFKEGRPWYRICSCQPTVGLVILGVIKIFFHCSNSLFFSWLKNAQMVPWPSLCIKISPGFANDGILYKNPCLEGHMSLLFNFFKAYCYFV